CAASGVARVLASRAQLGPGLDVSVLETGFGVALASGKSEAVGLRVEGSGLRVAETVRVKAPSLVSHAVVEAGHEDDGDSFDVRIDSDEARTIVGGEGPAFRVVARGGAIMALVDDLHGVRIRNLWAVPGARFTAPPSPVAPAKSNPYRPAGFSKLPAADAARSASRIPVYAPETVRAVGRDDGGAVVALRRSSMFYLGVTDAALDPAGPLAALSRNGATVGTPALAAWGGGGVVAWAERPAGEREWTIMVAGFTPDGEGATTVGPVRAIGKGMSPTLAALPDGDVLLAHADGPSGGHRVVALRLGRDLEPRGEPLVVSPESVNAGQPALAVRPDGRALVAFFAADRGRAASVFATSLACDPGL
ncbi:MAG: Basic proline-rich protein, partial [Labilithrix sp.]|nr:Basic proline-rich protein [Labilithrix sp.]